MRIIIAVLIAAAPTGLLAQAVSIQPGQWETTLKIQSMTMEGAPPQVAAMMRGHTTTVRSCLTAADAAKGPQELLKTNKSCSFTRYDMAGGRLSTEMVCRQGGSTTTATSTGSYTPTSMTAQSHVVGTGRMAMNMTSTVTGRRIGDCK